MQLFDELGRRLLTIQQIADRRGVSKAAVEKSRQRGALPEPAGFVDRRTPLWLETDVIEFHVPAELTTLRRWTRHAAKRPTRIDGTPASSTNPLTWSTYSQASSATTGDGLGFVLNGDGIVCIDLDHCIYEGHKVIDAVAEILESCPPTWVEISPSGTGLHIWGRAPLPKGRRTKRIEMYGNGRMMTVTGRRWRQSPLELADLTEVVGSLY